MAKFTRQKVDYIHMNPVAAGIVDEPEHYLFFWTSKRKVTS